MDTESLLLTHAEIAVAVAGFASVAAVLQRPLMEIQRNRFYTILLVSLQQILGGLGAVWLSRLGLEGSQLWRTASALYLGLAVLVGLFLIMPTVRLGAKAGIVINAAITVVIYSVAIASYTVLLVNLFIVPEPGFGLYYASMLAGLLSGFIVFAEIATQRDEEPM